MCNSDGKPARYSKMFASITNDITQEEIKSVVLNFYGKVRQDSILGPIFEREMSESWEQHLEKMCNFWTAVMLGKPVYHGNPLLTHRSISNINRGHFEHWLKLFHQTLNEVCPSRDHIEAFSEKAEKMARVLTGALV